MEIKSLITAVTNTCTLGARDHGQSVTIAEDNRPKWNRDYNDGQIFGSDGGQSNPENEGSAYRNVIS